MFPRSADRTGHSLLQRPGQHPGLLAEKGAVHSLIPGGLGVRLGLRTAVGVLCMGKLLLRLVQVLLGLQEGGKLFSAAFRTLLFTQEGLFPRAGIGEACHFRAELFQLAGEFLALPAVFLQRGFSAFQLRRRLLPGDSQGVPRVVLGKQCLQRRRVIAELFRLRQSAFCVPQSLREAFQPIFFPLQAFFRAEALGFRTLELFGPADLRVVFRDPPVKPAEFLSDLLEPFGIPFTAFFQQGERLLHGKLSFGRLLQPGIVTVVLRRRNTVQVLRDALPKVFACTVGRQGLVLQSVLKDAVGAGMEQLAEDRLPVLRVGQQQLQKVALGDHGDLGKLVPVQTQQGLQLPRHILRFGHGSAVRELQLRIGRLFRESSAASGGPLILRVSAHGIALPGMREDQFHLRGCFGGSVLRAQHGHVAGAAAGLAVKREGDRVKEARLSRAGIARNEVQAALAQFFKIHDGFTGIGPERGYGQQ